MNPCPWPHPPKILLVMGGFAQMGGIEIFAHDLSLFLLRHHGEVTLAYWPIRGRSPILDEMRSAGCGMIEGWVTRGVRFDLPDRGLALRLGSAPGKFDLVILLKLFSDPVLQGLLRAMRGKDGSKVPSLYVPSFCPAEDETYRDRPRPDVRLLNQLGAVMAQCPAMAEQVRSYLGYTGKVLTLPLLSSIGTGAPTPLPAAEGPRPRLRAAYIGRLTAQKNVQSLLDAYGRFLEEIEPNLSFLTDLHIHGDGAEAGRLKEHSVVTAHPDRVRFHGAYSTSDLPGIASQTHLFVQSTRFEGQCLAALEVMALGRPLIATRAGCLDSVINHRTLGQVVPQEDPLEFARAMAECGSKVLVGECSPQEIAGSFQSRFSRAALEPRYIEMIGSLIQA